VARDLAQPEDRHRVPVGGGDGRPGDPVAAAAGRRAVPRRANVVFSVPMLFFMGAASHMPPNPITHLMGYWIGVLVVVALIEINALTATAGPTTKPIEKIPGVITTGFVVWAVVYALVQWVLTA